MSTDPDRRRRRSILPNRSLQTANRAVAVVGPIDQADGGVGHDGLTIRHDDRVEIEVVDVVLHGDILPHGQHLPAVGRQVGV